MNIYVPVFGSNCNKCDHSPIVGLMSKNGVHSTELCGVCFFQDRSMVDTDQWNEPREDTE